MQEPAFVVDFVYIAIEGTNDSKEAHLVDEHEKRNHLDNEKTMHKKTKKNSC